MTVTIEQVAARCRTTRDEIELWIERRWIRPARVDGRPVFSDHDIARIELICDLSQDIGIEENAIDVILPLLDQVYALRNSMRLIAEAVADLPDEARERVLSRIAERGGR